MALPYTYIIGEIVLFIVVIYNSKTTFKLLLERGASGLFLNKNRDTILYYLAIKGNLYLLT